VKLDAFDAQVQPRPPVLPIGPAAVQRPAAHAAPSRRRRRILLAALALRCLPVAPVFPRRPVLPMLWRDTSSYIYGTLSVYNIVVLLVRCHLHDATPSSMHVRGTVMHGGHTNLRYHPPGSEAVNYIVLLLTCTAGTSI
jgi:hypothetical protein